MYDPVYPNYHIFPLDYLAHSGLSMKASWGDIADAISSTSPAMIGAPMADSPMDGPRACAKPIDKPEVLGPIDMPEVVEAEEPRLLQVIMAVFKI